MQGDTAVPLLLPVQIAQFPQSFEEIMIECLAERSPFIRAQRECAGERGHSVSLKIPAEVGRHWVRAVMSTPASLRATDASQLVHFLKVSSFSSCACRGADARRLGTDTNELFRARGLTTIPQCVCQSGVTSAANVILQAIAIVC